MVVVEQPEVVDVDEGDPDRPDVVASPVRSPAARSPTSAPWLSVSVRGSRRVDSRSASVWRVSRACASGTRGTGPPRRRLPAESVTIRISRRIASSRSRIGTASRHITDDPEHLVAHLEREQLAQQCRRCESRRTRRPPRWPGRSRPAPGPSSDARNSSVGRTSAAQPGLGRRDDRAVRASDLDTQDLAGPGQRAEPGLEPTDLARGQRVRRDEVVGSDVGIDERTDRRGIAADETR